MNKGHGTSTISTRLHGYNSSNLPAIILTTEKIILMVNCNIEVLLYLVSVIFITKGSNSVIVLHVLRK